MTLHPSATSVRLVHDHPGGNLVPDVSPAWLRLILWALLPPWLLWVGVSLVKDDTLASALTSENGLLQNLTVFFYGIAGLLLFRLALRQHHARAGRRLQRWWLLALGIGCVFIAGEEMNWGQTFLHYATPHWLEGANIQQEFSMHNLRLPGSLSGKHWANEILWWLAIVGGAVLPFALMYSGTFRRMAWMLELPIPPWLAQVYWLAAALIPRDGWLLGRLTRDNIPSELREVTIALAVAIWAWSLRRGAFRSHRTHSP